MAFVTPGGEAFTDHGTNRKLSRPANILTMTPAKLTRTVGYLPPAVTTGGGGTVPTTGQLWPRPA
jgi:hypothetical protein